MFRKLAAQVADGARILLSLHPKDLVGLLEQAWNLRIHSTSLRTGHPDHRSDVPGSSGGATTSQAKSFSDILANNTRVIAPGIPGVRWDHLIYAYMIENTRIKDIFGRVVHELLHGEKLRTPGIQTQLWLRSTEELFFRDTPSFSITTISSHIRPDLNATRRNAYQRMFGMDLNHGTDDNKPYPFVRAEAANNEFVTTFEELLRETWVGYINRSTTSGANPTDDSKIEELSRKLHDMLTTRRQSGNLSREEFFFVAMMSWFHLTVENDLFIIEDLRATAVSAEQRLFNIAQAVGLPAHGLSRSYFEIADALSAVLIAIETGTLHVSGAARAFYDPTAPNTLANFMNTINTHWSIITGHDMKSGKVALR